jgi:hypothetical protein
MSLQPQEEFRIPDQTRCVALAAFPKGCACLRVGDVLGCVYQDKQFGYFCPIPRKGLIGIIAPLVFYIGYGASPEVFILIAGSEGFDVDLR